MTATRLLAVPLAIASTLAAAQQPAATPPTPGPQTQPAQTPSGTQPMPGPNGTYTITRTARIVILDMVVTDAKGNVVTDLSKDDFHVTEMDEPQTVVNFEAAGAHVTPPSADINSTQQLDAAAPRAPVNIILLDEFNTRFEDMAFARYSLKKFLERQPGKLATPTMLIAVSLQQFSVLHDYTQSKDDLIAALDRHFAGYPWQAHNFSWVGERYATAFLTLRRVAQAVIGHPGHKNMIWIGRGFPSIVMANYPLDTENRINNAVQDCVNTLRDARVTLYTIDPAGLQIDPGAYGAGAALNDPFGGNYQFARLATATGGKALYGRNDVDAEIGTAIRDGAAFYTLTYRPTNESASLQKFRRIKVTVDRPGLNVTTREGYYLAYGPGRVDPQKPSQRLVTDLLSAENSNMVYNAVPLSLTRAPDTPDRFKIHVDQRALYWTPVTDTRPQRYAEVILMATTFDRKNKELFRDAKTVRVAATGDDVPPTGRLERGIDFNYELKHDPKAVRVRFVVRITASGRIGTADADLKPPPASASTPPPAKNTAVP